MSVEQLSETDNLPEKEFRVMIVKTDPGSRGKNSGKDQKCVRNI